MVVVAALPGALSVLGIQARCFQLPFFKGHQSDSWNKRYGGMTNRALPDFIEKWGRKPFFQFGVVAGLGSVTTSAILGGSWWLTVPMVGAYWLVGRSDIISAQAVRRNFPVLGHFRYILESIRPEIRQYFIESDQEAAPFSRECRAVAYQRAKGLDPTQSFGTRRNILEVGYEWMEHSNLSPGSAATADEMRVPIGERSQQPYTAALLNISAMSYGAISRNAVLALNSGAKIGGFYHNTGEGGVSPWHLEMGGDIVWNIGTGYFGCRTPEGTFSEEHFLKTALHPNIKMIEVKLSQGAKPGHGGLLPASKLTQELADIRGVPMGQDVHSPASHSAFSGPEGLVTFMARLRELSGKPVGFKMCVGSVQETVAMVKAMHRLQEWPDFITIDGGEGGTGAAPPVFSDRVGWPLEEALVLVDDLLTGAGLRDKVKIICAGKIVSSFAMVRALALGADACNTARGMMFALGCIQALKCNTNKCPTGIATQNPDLMEGLCVHSKKERVANYQRLTVRGAAELLAAGGFKSPRELRRRHIKRRVSEVSISDLGEIHPEVPAGALLTGQGPKIYQHIWDAA